MVTCDSDHTRGAIGLDSNGDVVAAGMTASTDFPTMIGPSFNGGEHDPWVAKLAANGGSLIWSTYMGGNGSESFHGNLEVHADDPITLGGFSNSRNFPTTRGAIQPTFLGGSGRDRGRCLQVGGSGEVLITGDTGGGMPPPTIGSFFDTSFNCGSDDAFIAVSVPEPSRVASAAAAFCALAAVARRRRR